MFFLFVVLVVGLAFVFLVLVVAFVFVYFVVFVDFVSFASSISSSRVFASSCASFWA